MMNKNEFMKMYDDVFCRVKNLHNYYDINIVAGLFAVLDRSKTFSQKHCESLHNIDRIVMGLEVACNHQKK